MQTSPRLAAMRWWAVVPLVCLILARNVDDHLLAAGAAVVWMNRVGVVVAGDVLQKTTGCDGCDDAGATSEQQISAGDGYIEFTVGEANTLFLAGLSHGNSGSTYADVDFAFRFNGAGTADVLENGTYVGGDTVYVPGDIFRVAIVNGTVQYSRNGAVLLERLSTLQYPYLLDTSFMTIGATIRGATIASILPSVPGGFVETAGASTYRARFTPAQIASFLPPNGARGPFTFPAPYSTQGVRLTTASDCAGGQDCLWYVGYSYWRNTNNHAGSDTLYILLGFDRNRGGGGPSLLAYDKVTDQVQNLGPLFAAASTYSYSTAEGWYFSATLPTRVYTFLPGGTALRRYDVVARQFEAAAALDLNQCPRPAVCPSNAAFINQPHSSDDDAVHSVTVQDASFQRLGCAVNRPAGWVYVPLRAGYALDECHVDKSGRWLMVLEGQLSTGALDNRIIDLTTGAVATLADAAGGLGHLDMGFGYAVGADNYNPYPNATILLKFPVISTTRPVGPVVHFNKRWDIVAANHIAHGNAVPGRAADEQYACGSHASRVADMADEIVCFPLNPHRNADGSLDVLVAGQVMTDLDAPGGGGGDYEKMPKGNLDVTGRYFIWTTNLGGNRLDALLVKIPAGLLGAATANGSPVAADRSAVTASGTPATVTLSATDAETCELVFSVATSPAHGALSGLSQLPCAAGSPNTDTAQMTYTPNAGFAGTDTFTYRVSDGAATSAAATVAITVTASQSSMHVGDLDKSASLEGGYWRATVSVQVHDTGHAAVAGAVVAGTWSVGQSGAVSCTTDNTGQCSVTSGSIPKNRRTATLSVTAVQHATLAYQAVANHDPDGDSNGTSIAVRKP